ncbi:MAG: single-stranded DNA-binding protein [Candidatus Brocadiia bacterium]|jgi:single-strand DNA-binding protein|nr:single-stranded DNA-binding protein [Candidatus Brocadiia bacterium]
MASLNKVFLMGNLTRDPQLRYTPSGTPICEFGVAVNRRFKSKEGEQRDETCFVDVTAWGRTGEVISEYFSKGKPILIEGRLKFDSWETPDGRRSKLSVVAENFQFIGGRDDRENSEARPGRRAEGTRAEGGQPRGERPSGRRDSAQGAPRKEQAPDEAKEPEQEGFDVSDDEIPF